MNLGGVLTIQESAMYYARQLLLGVLVGAVLEWFPASVEAQDVDELFRKVSPAVVVIKARGREVTRTRGLVTYAEIGSGVLVSPDGKVITAAHVVHAMDEITVEFFGGEAVPARVVASEPAADLSMLQLTRVPAGPKSRDSATPTASGSASRCW